MSTVDQHVQQESVPNMIRALVIFLLINACFAHEDAEDDGDEDVRIDLMDLINIVMFVFAGGADQVFARVIFIITFMIMFSIFMIATLCFITTYPIRCNYSAENVWWFVRRASVVQNVKGICDKW